MVSVGELKQTLGITGAAEDDYLAELEAAAVQFVETQTGRYFGAVREVTEYRTAAGNSLFLSDEPTGTVTVMRRSSATATAEAVAADQFAVRGRRLVNPAGWGWYEYEITYDAGYAPGAQPEDIRDAVRDLVALAYRTRAGVQSETMGGYHYTLADGPKARWRETIEKYKGRRRKGIA